MSTYEKLCEAIRKNPANVRWDSLLRMLAAEGFIHQSTRGSHYNFTHPDLPGRVLTIPWRSGAPPKAVYVKKALDWIDELKGE